MLKFRVWHLRNLGNMETIYNHKILKAAKMYITAQKMSYHGWILPKNMHSCWDLQMKQEKYI